MASIHNRKLIAALWRELKEKDSKIQDLRQNINTLENKLNELSIQAKKLLNSIPNLYMVSFD